MYPYSVEWISFWVVLCVFMLCIREMVKFIYTAFFREADKRDEFFNGDT